VIREDQILDAVKAVHDRFLVSEEVVLRDEH
jgi:hypothetical protein